MTDPTIEEVIEQVRDNYIAASDGNVAFHEADSLLREKLTLVRDTARSDTIKEVTGILEGMKEENPNYDHRTNLIVIALNKVLDDALTAITNIAKGE